MKLVVRKDNLIDRIKKVLSYCTSNDEQNITSHLLFDVDDDGVSVKASDNFVCVSLRMEEGDGFISSEGPMQFTVEEGRLKKWLKNTIGEEVEFQYNEGDLRLKCGDFQTPMPTHQNVGSFPSLAYDGSFEVSTELMTTPVSIVLDAFEFISQFVADDVTKADPTGKFKVAQMRGDEFHGTDSNALGIYKSEMLDCNMKVSFSQLKPLIKYLKYQPKDIEVGVFDGGKFTFLSTDDGSYYGLLTPPNELPNLKNIPTDLIERHIVDVQRSDVEQAIGSLKAISDEEDRDLHVELDGNTTQVVFSKRSEIDGEMAVSKIPCEWKKSVTENLTMIVPDDLLETAVSEYGEQLSLVYNPAKHYLKLYEKTETEDLKVCLIKLRKQMG